MDTQGANEFTTKLICPSCMSCVNLQVTTNGRIDKAKLTKVKKKSIDEKKKESSTIYIRDNKGNTFAWGVYNPKSWSKYSYGHNTLDVKRQCDKARFLDEENNCGHVGVRLERFCEIKLETMKVGKLLNVFDKSTKIVTDNGAIDCEMQCMTPGERKAWCHKGIGHFVNKQDADKTADVDNIDICFYDTASGPNWPSELDDPPLIHGQLRVACDQYDKSNSVTFDKLLLVDSRVVWSKDRQAKGHSEEGRYFMTYYVENIDGSKRFKKQREYYDNRRDHFWLNNLWYQRY